MQYKDAIRIGNYTSPDFHLQFSSCADLVVILKVLFEYKLDPDNYAQPIVIMIDE